MNILKDFKDNIEIILGNFMKSLEMVDSPEQLSKLQSELLGKNSVINQELRNLKDLDPAERVAHGARLNQIKQTLLGEIEAKAHQLRTAEINRRLLTETLDVTLSSRPHPRGSLHLLPAIAYEIRTILESMGFIFCDGPDIEDEHHNFDALNIPALHPARGMHDTFYLRDSAEEKNSLLLRTHTSPVQIRTLRECKPPLQIMTIGRVYRADAFDATHTPMFHQIEGLMIGSDVNMRHLHSCLQEFFRRFLKEDKDIALRFRPSFFPFTEPSVEVDIAREDGKWLELLGCGMVHPKVLEHCGVDPSQYQGFAFGMGLERLAMIRTGIDDLRHFFAGDFRWLSHYNASHIYTS